MLKRGFVVCGLASAMLLAGCGGGGDAGGGFVPPSGDFNAQVAWQNIVRPAALRSWAVTGKGSDNVNYSLSLSVLAAAGANFPLNGTAYSVGNLGSTIAANGTALGNGSIEVFFDAAETKVRGLRNTSNVVTGPNAGTFVTCDEVVTTFVPPVATKANTSGPLYTANIHESCVPGSNVIGTSTATWSVEYEGFSATMFFCVNSEDRDLGNNPVITTEKDCVELDESGALSARGRARITLNSNGPTFNLVARNF